MNKHEPRNQEEAFCYQWMDDVKTLRAVALQGKPEDFARALQTLKTHIATYEQLSKASKAKQKLRKFMKKKLSMGNIKIGSLAKRKNNNMPYTILRKDKIKKLQGQHKTIKYKKVKKLVIFSKGNTKQK